MAAGGDAWRQGISTEEEAEPQTDEVTFKILGPLEAGSAQDGVRVPPGRQQVILAALLMEADQIVSTDFLVDAIWDENPPDTARTQVQICVSRLRKSLSAIGGADRIVTRSPGYLLHLGRDLLDVHVYNRLVAEADVLQREGRHEQATALLHQAVALWRGPALSGIPSRVLEAKAARLDEDRLATVEGRIELELGLGRHRQLIGELSTLVQEHPLRERLRAQLMLALYRSGRQVEALDAYRTGRDRLMDELGLKPGDELRSLETAILSGDPALHPEQASAPGMGGGAAHTSSAPVPHPGEVPSGFPDPEARPQQLTSDTSDFVGRSDLLRSVEEVLVGTAESRAVGVAVIIGKPGVGKSAMATHIGHRLMEEHFPDGQLYCDLRGTQDHPTTPADALGRFLRAFGVPGQAIPEDTDERAEMYRSLLARKRVLVVLDDAVGESQVTPLLPGSSSCGVIVTSRARLTGVPGSQLTELDVLTIEQSLDLLGRALGRERVMGEHEAAMALVRTVGRLPLALRIVAARLAARPHWSLASMLNRLADERNRLDELAHGELTIRASLSLTYDGMAPDTRRVLRLLGLADGTTIPGWVAGALLDDHRPFPSDLLEELVDAQMLDVAALDVTGDPRYRFHDIIRVFAREQLAQREDRKSVV